MSDVVTIAPDTFTIYGTLAAAVSRFNGQLSPAATKWRAATDDDRARALVTAAQIIDRQRWRTMPVDLTSFGARDGVVDFQTGSYELAGQVLLGGGAIVQQTSTGSNVRKAEAGGGVSVEFFNPTYDEFAMWPPSIQDLLGQYLAGAESGISGSSASGTGHRTARTKFGITVAD